MPVLPRAGRCCAQRPTPRHAPQNRFNLAYDAAHDVGEAMLAGYGYRTRHGQGQHDALARFIAAVFDTHPENAASRHLDQMRHERNAQRCRAVPHTLASSRVATDTAQILLDAAQGRRSAR